MNSIHALVLFNSGATRSFVSIEPSRRFDDVPIVLYYPLEVEIVDDHQVQVSMVHRGLTLELLNEQYPIDSVLIPLHESKLIMGMDWLSPNGEMIDSGLWLVHVQIPSGGELVIHGEGAQRGLALHSAARARC